MKKSSHFDKKGNACMVDISEKPVTQRTAIARCSVFMKKETLDMIKEGKVSKGDVLGIARVAGIMAAKRAPEIIPLCHPLNISSVNIEFQIDPKKKKITINSCVKITGQTGVEMEALTSAAASALTIYDMCKSVDKEMIISDLMLIKKTGGKSGAFTRQPNG